MLQTTKQISDRLKNGFYDAFLSRIYSDINSARERYLAAVSEFEKHFGKDENVAIISVPGRTEVAGNHTDHQHGIVLAASVSLDAVAVISKRNDGKVGFFSHKFGAVEIDISSTDIVAAESGKTAALIRGMADGFKKNGLNVGGFNMYVQSDVLAGSGLSSSACFEVLCGTVISYLYNDDSVAPYKIAMIGQYAENNHFGKPCGLMDQMACAVGGLVKIDFKDEKFPDFNKVPFEPEKAGYRLCIIDTRGSHEDLTEDYASVPADMKKIASALGKKYLREVDEKDFFANIKDLREKFGDRAVLRASHYFNEVKRVIAQSEYLENNDFGGFLSLVNEAGASAVMYNQNAYSSRFPQSQGVVIGLMLCSEVLGKNGAFRLQGGGFAGTIQAYVPEKLVKTFTEKMESVFGEGCNYVLNVRPCGAAIFD